MSNRTSRASEGRLRIRRHLLELPDDLREARLRLGLRQRDLARAARWSQSRVARLEAGRLAKVSFLVSRFATRTANREWLRAAEGVAPRLQRAQDGLPSVVAVAQRLGD
ncbi:MAG TPA: helix-turn-helix domain-containing protein [candidate division Zixibacteria bacterium]|nr:helix-turn-helix domain-containing protein [candidate division Zixibacteria bacterium]